MIKGKRFCDKCNTLTKTSKKYEQHVLTKKHINNMLEQPRYVFKCPKCMKTYNSQKGFATHKIKCNPTLETKLEGISTTLPTQNEHSTLQDNSILQKIVDELKESNKDFLQSMKEIRVLFQNQQSISETNCKEMKDLCCNLLQNQQPTAIINTNINLFLKEQCNEALNMDMFAKNIVYEFGNTEDMITDYVKGSMSILKKNWEQIPLNKRPMHYIEGEDPHQKIFHIRHNDEWKIDTELNCMKQINSDEICPTSSTEKQTLYFALKQLDEGKIAHLGSTCFSNELYMKNYKKIFKEVTNRDYKMQLFSEVMKLITLDPNNIKKLCV